MNITEFNIVTFEKGKDFYTKPRIYCNDGFNMSVQGSAGHYCQPRQTVISYDFMEVGYPSEAEYLLKDFAEDDSNLCETVYGYVPIEIIQAVIEEHGGIDVEKTFNSPL